MVPGGKYIPNIKVVPAGMAAPSVNILPAGTVYPLASLSSVTLVMVVDAPYFPPFSKIPNQDNQRLTNCGFGQITSVFSGVEPNPFFAASLVFRICTDESNLGADISNNVAYRQGRDPIPFIRENPLEMR